MENEQVVNRLYTAFLQGAYNRLAGKDGIPHIPPQDRTISTLEPIVKQYLDAEVDDDFDVLEYAEVIASGKDKLYDELDILGLDAHTEEQVLKLVRQLSFQRVRYGDF